MNLTALAVGGCATDVVRRDPTVEAEIRAVKFLAREVPAWSRDNSCFSCHNNGDAARALYAATRKGHRVAASALADTTAWVARPDRWDRNKGDPGFSDKRLANVQFAASLLAAFEAGHVKDCGSLQEAARKVAADQAADGTWPIEPANPVGSPATYGTTLATYMALRTLRQADAPGTSDAIRKAEDWLHRASPDNVPAAATLLLAAVDENVEAQSGQLPLNKPGSADLPVGPGARQRVPAGLTDTNREVRLMESLPAEIAGVRANPAPNSVILVEESLNLIRRAQTSDGGWGPYADSPPEPFDTAVVLLALAELRQHPGVTELVRRGRIFLAERQNRNGSWPATTRPPGGDSYAQRVSTTGWVTLALLATR